MFIIISYLISFLNRINKLLWKLITFLSTFIKVDDVTNINSKPDDIRYRHFSVDKPAIIEPFVKPDKLDYLQLILEKNIKPVKRRSGNSIPSHISCPRCDAPSIYLYDNTGKGNQFECKVCSNLFSTNPNPFKDVILKCPYCKRNLYLKHQREDFNVYSCSNPDCNYYLHNINSMSKDDKVKFKKNPNFFKLHYIYRLFKIDIPSLYKDFKDFIRSPIDLSKAYHSLYTIALCLTYHVNYGLSFRSTSAILFDVHQLKISHQTVANYCNSVAPIVQPILEFFPYDLSDTLAGDETYIKIKGVTHYVFFIFDAVKKIITSYRVFEKRDSISAIKAVWSSLKKYVKLPETFKLITDGNPIYNVACQFWSQHGLPFNLFQVIGLKNNTDTDKEYRSQKQIIERHNRTFKFYYRPTNGLTSIFDANTYMILFSVCFNFLRPHSSLGYKVPQPIDSVISKPNMPSKWIELIRLGYEYSEKYLSS